MCEQNKELPATIIDELHDKAEEIRGNIFLIKMFCEQYYHVDDFYKVRALINYTDSLSDVLYTDLINLKDQ